MITSLGFEVRCDNCGNSADGSPVEGVDRREAVINARNQGWTVKCPPGKRLMHLCPRCTENPERDIAKRYRQYVAEPI